MSTRVEGLSGPLGRVYPIRRVDDPSTLVADANDSSTDPVEPVGPLGSFLPFISQKDPYVR